MLTKKAFVSDAFDFCNKAKPPHDLIFMILPLNQRCRVLAKEAIGGRRVFHTWAISSDFALRGCVRQAELGSCAIREAQAQFGLNCLRKQVVQWRVSKIIKRGKKEEEMTVAIYPGTFI